MENPVPLDSARSRLKERKKAIKLNRPRTRTARKEATQDGIIKTLLSRKYRKSITKTTIDFEALNVSLKENAVSILEKSEQKIKLLSIIKNADAISETQKVDFFSRTWQEDARLDKNLEKNDDYVIDMEAIQKEVKIDMDPDKSRKDSHEINLSKPIGRDDSSDFSKDFEVNVDGKLYNFVPSEYVSWSDRFDLEKKNYFVTSSKKVVINEKLNDRELYYKETEGFFVGDRPFINRSNLNRIENRIVKQNVKDISWFEADGNVLTETNLIDETEVEYYNIFDVDSKVKETYYTEAVIERVDYSLIDGKIDSTKCYELIVDINTIKFNHHHLFSKEHTIARKLESYYNAYLQKQKVKNISYLTNKIKSIRKVMHATDMEQVKTKEKIEEIIEEKQDQDQDNQSLIIPQLKKKESKLEIYTNQEDNDSFKAYHNELKKYIYERKIEMISYTNIITEILRLWKIIKQMRQSQKYINTNVKLYIKKININKTNYDNEMKQEITYQALEEKRILRMKYSQDMTYYKQQLEKWQAQKSINEKEKRIELPKKPKKSDANVNKAEIKQNIASYWPDIVVQMLRFKLSHGETITKEDDCPIEEIKRRHDVINTKILAKIYYNNKLATIIQPILLTHDFNIQFLTQFTLKIVEWPKSVELKIYEMKGCLSHVLSRINLPIPDYNQTVTNSILDCFEFSSDIKKMHHHTAVGSGTAFTVDWPAVNLKSSRKNLNEDDGDKMENLTMAEYTTFNLFASLSWNVDKNGNILAPKIQTKNNQIYNSLLNVDPIAAIGMSGLCSMSKLTNWTNKNRIDPNDPVNAEIVYLLKSLETNYTISNQVFRVEPLIKPFNFVDDITLNNSNRFKLLTFRQQGIDKYVGYTFIPIYNKEVSTNMIKLNQNETVLDVSIKTTDIIQNRRKSVIAYMKKIREQVMRRYKLSNNQSVLSDIVEEEMVPNIGEIFPKILKLMEPRRPLRPIRKERKSATSQLFLSTGLKVLINIVRALDVPVRVESLNRDSKDKYQNMESLVNPFIQIMFQRKVYNTFIADGPNPSWNVELELDYNAPNGDYTMVNLLSSNETIFLSLFDNFVEESVDDEFRIKNESALKGKFNNEDTNVFANSSSVKRRIEKRWLGNLEIPFSSLFSNTHLEGTFCLNKPPVLLGYKFKNENKDRSGTEKTYLTLFATLEPPVSIASNVVQRFDSNESDEILDYAEKWTAELNLKFNNRYFMVTAIDISGRSVVATRFCTSDGIKPPDELLTGNSDEEKLKRLARFVSLIPFISDAEMFSGICDIWSTCDQFIHMLQGDDEEHALLLLAYFKYIEIECWLLMCNAIPEGKTAYVLTYDKKGAYTIWNPNTGENFSHNDPYCPVQIVGCLINHENIWVNIQPIAKPSEVDFNTSNIKKWTPFFNRKFPNNGISSIQPKFINYSKSDTSGAINLQYSLEQKLKEKVMQWRPKYITRWNRHCIHTFRTLLQKLEENNGIGNYDEHSEELSTILASYKLSGFPINIKYLDEESLIENVYSTGVYDVDNQDVEFALAIYVHPYPNNIMSVWVYIASMIRRR
ncbi:Coiled-coil and C2 domain-containing protein 2A [Intoshia linei]|uniref:Coiled-coil and C2 domain-containing protein 2A n=1 Tax=Intoshia linei TaxID=1819745 RepID=A0A177BBX4_9BILA|nr:Coiled-coil and C2 domain-containing protein 2A [Intoshia linei]